MRAALRIAAVLALAVPLGASALPASAAAPSHVRDRGAFAETYLSGEGTPGGLPGNYSLGQLTFYGSVVEGVVETFACEEGQTPYAEEDACQPAGYYYAFTDGITVVGGTSKKSLTTFSGSLDLYDAESEADDPAATNVPFSITLTPVGRPSRSRFTESFRDPESGDSYRFRSTTVVSVATVHGDLDGIDATEGLVGRYSFHGMEQIS